MQVEPEVVGYEAVVTQPVHRQVTLELFIPVFDEPSIMPSKME
jgi:hypothetical protein